MKRLKPPVHTYDVALSGELEGFALKMRGMSSADFIRLKTRGTEEMGDIAALDMAFAHVVEHNFDVDDLRELDVWIGLEILNRWVAVLNESALPPASATS